MRISIWPLHVRPSVPTIAYAKICWKNREAWSPPSTATTTVIVGRILGIVSIRANQQMHSCFCKRIAVLLRETCIYWFLPHPWRSPAAFAHYLAQCLSPGWIPNDPTCTGQRRLHKASRIQAIHWVAAHVLLKPPLAPTIGQGIPTDEPTQLCVIHPVPSLHSIATLTDICHCSAFRSTYRTSDASRLVRRPARTLSRAQAREVIFSCQTTGVIVADRAVESEAESWIYG